MASLGLDSRSLRAIESISWHYRASGSVHNNFPHLVLRPNVASAGLAMSSDSPKTTQSKPSTNLIQQSLAGRDLVADLVPGGWQRRIHVIPKWWQINYSFVCMLITPLGLVSMYKTQKNFEVKMRQRGLINMQTKE